MLLLSRVAVQYECLKATTVRFKATTVQYEVLRVDRCQNKEKLRVTVGIGWDTSKCERAQRASEEVGGASVSTRTCFRSTRSVRSSLCDRQHCSMRMTVFPRKNLGRLEFISLCSSESSWM